MKLTMYF